MNDPIRPSSTDPTRRCRWPLGTVWLCFLCCSSSLAQTPPTESLRMVPPAESEPATESFHAQLPTTDWRAVDADALPPPPGWVAAEFASLSPTQGSSPESEPLFPGDELTMETGRLASHRSGFFQKLSITGAWFNRNGVEDMGMVEARSFLTVALPLPSRDFPLLVTTGFDATPLDGPASPNLPGTVTFKRLLTQGQIEQMRGQFGLRYVNIQYVTNAGGTGQFGYGTDTLENVEKSLQQHLGPALRIEGVVAIEVTAPPADLRRFAQQPEVLLLELAELLPLADSWYQARFQPSIWERYKRTCP